MDTDNRSGRAAIVALVAGVSLLLATACARTSVQDVQVMASGLPRPSVVLVHPFAASGGVVTLSGGVLSRAMEAMENTPEAQQREQVARQVTQVLAQKLVKRIQDLGLPAELASAAAPAGGSTLSIEGQILSIDEGNPTRRMIIGLGAGSSEVRTLVQVYATTSDGRRLVEDFYTTVKSSRKPGMAETMGAGAAAGRVAESAAVSVGVTALTAHSQTVEGDAEAAAKAIAKQLSSFFFQQGWIPPGMEE
jgi:Domain of unknown function (DUF4410)